MTFTRQNITLSLSLPLFDIGQTKNIKIIDFFFYQNHFELVLLSYLNIIFVEKKVISH